jgi:hypothetical protein
LSGVKQPDQKFTHPILPNRDKECFGLSFFSSEKNSKCQLTDISVGEKDDLHCFTFGCKAPAPSPITIGIVKGPVSRVLNIVKKY